MCEYVNEAKQPPKVTCCEAQMPILKSMCKSEENTGARARDLFIPLEPQMSFTEKQFVSGR